MQPRTTGWSTSCTSEWRRSLRSARPSTSRARQASGSGICSFGSTGREHVQALAVSMQLDQRLGAGHGGGDGERGLPESPLGLRGERRARVGAPEGEQGLPLRLAVAPGAREVRLRDQGLGGHVPAPQRRGAAGERVERLGRPREISLAAEDAGQPEASVGVHAARWAAPRRRGGRPRRALRDPRARARPGAGSGRRSPAARWRGPRARPPAPAPVPSGAGPARAGTGPPASPSPSPAAAPCARTGRPRTPPAERPAHR